MVESLKEEGGSKQCMARSGRVCQGPGLRLRQNLHAEVLQLAEASGLRENSKFPGKGTGQSRNL